MRLILLLLVAEADGVALGLACAADNTTSAIELVQSRDGIRWTTQREILEHHTRDGRGLPRRIGLVDLS